MLVFDIDGVVADSFQVIVETLAEHAGCQVSDIDNSQHDMFVPGLTNGDEFLDAFADALVNRVDEIPAFTESVEFIKKYQQLLGQPVIFLTARQSRIGQATVQWLDSHFSDTPYLLFMHDDKKQFLRSKHVKCTGIVEDRLRTVNELDFLPSVFLLNKQWNIGRSTASHVRRVDTMHDIWAYILKN